MHQAITALSSGAPVSCLVDLITPLDLRQAIDFLALINRTSIEQQALWPTVVLCPDFDFHALANFEQRVRVWVHGDSESDADFEACIQHLAGQRAMSHLLLPAHESYVLQAT